MAKSILEIEVADEAFNAFHERFKKYRDEVGEMAGDWKGTEEAVAAVGAGFATMTAALIAQRKAEREQEETLRKQRTAQTQLFNLEKQRRAEMHKMLQDSMKLAKTIGGVTLDLFKWVGFGGLLGAVGAGLGMFGLDRLAQGVTDTRRAALSNNVSTGQLVGMRAEFGRYVDVNGALGNVAQAQFDPQSQWAFNQMGISNASKRDPAEMLLEIMAKAGPMFKAMGENPLLAHAHGLDKFLSMGELRTLAGLKPGELGGAIKDYRGQEKNLELIDKANQEWGKFGVALEMAKAKVEIAFVGALTNAVGPLGDFATKIGDTIANLLKSKEFADWIKKAGVNIENFVLHTDWNKLAGNLNRAATDLGILAGKMEDLLVFLHLVPEPGLTSSDPKVRQNAQRMAFSKNLAYTDPILGLEIVGGGMASDAIKGAGHWIAHGAEKLMKGVPVGPSGPRPAFGHAPMEAMAFPLAIQAVLAAESTGFKLHAFNGQGGGEGARGWAQWRDGKKGGRLWNFRHVEGVDPLQASAAQQADFIKWEMANTKMGRLAARAVAAAKTDEDKARAFVHFFEGPGKAGEEVDMRYARAWLRASHGGHSPHDATARRSAAQHVKVTIHNPAGASVHTATRAAAGQQ